MEAEVNEIIEKSLQKAQAHDRTGNVGKAYAYYTVVAELCPAKRKEIEKVFTDVLCEWGMQLAEKNRFQDVMLCYKHSLDIYPNNPRMLNNFAAHLLRNGDPMKAIDYLKHALEIDSAFLPAERNLQNAYSMAVDRWHFPMLNDKRRNRAFERAIRNRICQGYDTVLDVGTGTGLLSLYAHDAGAKKVYACEYSVIMANIAKKVFEHNNGKDIQLISKFSSDLEIPSDISERVKLIVTETFDAGLFGEFVVPSIMNVHMNILDNNGMGMVIPMSATLYTAVVECEYIRYRSSVLFDKIRNTCPLNFDTVSVLPDDEYYDTENLENVNINYVTEPQILFTVNFNDLSELQEFSKDGIKCMIDIKCRYNSIIDGLVTWFKLHLDEEITIDSSEGKSCWQRAVFPMIPVKCEQGDILTIKAEMTNGKLKCSYTSNNIKPVDNNKVLYRLPREIIAFLNDSEYVKSLSQVSKSLSEKKVKYILDTCPFPIFGLMLLKENKHSELLYYETDNSVLHSLIENIAIHNGLWNKVRIISSYDQIEYPLDIIFIHNFDMKGELKDWGQDSYHEFFRDLLKSDGILLPEQIFLMGQLIFSEDLPKMVSVKDMNLQRVPFVHSSSSSEKTSDEEENFEDDRCKDDQRTNYVIAEYINEFKIDQIFDLNSSLYLYEPLSEVKTMIEMNENEITEAIVHFGKINIRKNEPLPNALVCWYNIKLTENHKYTTRKNESFMNHTAIVLEDELKDVILKHKDVNIKVQQMKGLIKITLLNN